jgi:hypothetical protein
MMRDLSGENLTETVLASFESSTSPRYKEVMQSLVGHLHDFVEEIEPTEEEWFEAIRFLTRTGQIANADRQEFILLSDTLGVSMLVVGINHRKATGAAESAGAARRSALETAPRPARPRRRSSARSSSRARPSTRTATTSPTALPANPVSSKDA